MRHQVDNSVSSAAPVVVFFNPGAGSGLALPRLQRVLSDIPTLGARCAWAAVHSTADAVTVLQNIDPLAIPVAAGGDGTANLLASALRTCGLLNTPMAVIPCGTGNAFAHALGVTGVRSALDTIVAGVVRRVDVMRSSHPDAPLALVSFSAGFEGAYIHRFANLRPRGRPAAALAALAATGIRSTRGVLLEVDGEVVVRQSDAVYNAGLYNTRCFASGRVVWPNADDEDGLGEGVVCRTARAYWGTLWRGLRGPQGSAADPLWRPWRTARIESRGPMQADGEAIAGAEATVWMERRALPVLVPSAMSPISRPARLAAIGSRAESSMR